MSQSAIVVEGVSKRYAIGPTQAYETLRDQFANGLKRLFRRQPGSNNDQDTIWALKDVSFEVKEGEVMGIIGRNGSGKSTLLKILSRITEPTEGKAEIRGRVGSLLEVGTGFHPELTGRENIYLNAAVLGMRKSEIRRKFEEILAFSEVERLIDTPVKHYSSGMYVRLAFAVAAHLETEILLIDEVLAVGDLAFQEKCLGKMEDVAKKGRTVLFVSHNMSAIITLCSKAILLQEGHLVMESSVEKVVSSYTSTFSQLIAEYRARENHDPPKLRIDRVILMRNGTPTTVFYNSESMIVRVEFTTKEHLVGPQIALELFTELHECILSSTNQDWDGVKKRTPPGAYTAECPINLNMFRPGRYYLQISSSVPSVEMLDSVDKLLSFEVYDDSGPILKLGQNRRGIILPIIQWRTSPRTFLEK